MKRTGIIGVVLCLFLIAVTTEVKAKSDVGEKAVGGVVNVALGWTEPIAEPFRGWTSDRSPVEKIFETIPDIFKGGAKFAARTLGGFVDFIASPFPGDSVIKTCPIVDDHL